MAKDNDMTPVTIEEIRGVVSQVVRSEAYKVVHGVVNEAVSRLSLEMNRRFAEVDERFSSIDGQLVGIDGQLVRIDGELVGIDGELVGIDGRLESLDLEVRKNGVLLEEMRDDIKLLAEGHGVNLERIELNAQTLEKHEKRIGDLEIIVSVLKDDTPGKRG